MTLPGAGDKLVCVGNYRLTGKRLGKGNFAKVEEAVHTVLNVKVAIKIMNVSEIKEDYVIQNLHREARLMSKLSHPCITALFETMQHENMYYLVTELVGGGDLCTYIKNQRSGKLDERHTRMFGRQLVSAVAHMHQIGIVHRDLKMENIMLNSTKTQLKIVDFGLSNQWSADRPLRTHCGSPEYAAPELFLAGKRYGPKVDLWSLGVILYGMVLGQLPFISCRDDNITSQERRKRLLAQINRGLAPIHRKALVGFSADFKNMVARLLTPDPEKRLSINDLVFHPWITESGHMHLHANPLHKMDSGMQSEIIKDIALLTKLDSATVSRNIQSNSFGHLSGMYNVIKYKKQSSLMDTDSIVRRNYHVTLSAKSTRTPKKVESALHGTPLQCTPRQATPLRNVPLKSQTTPKPTTVKSVSNSIKKAPIAASPTKSLQLRRPSTTQQQPTPSKNVAVRRPLSVPKVPSRPVKEAKLEAGDVATTRAKSIAKRTGYNLRATLARMKTPPVTNAKANSVQVSSARLENVTKSEPLSSRKNAASVSHQTPERPAKRRSVLPVITTSSAPIRNVISAMPTRVNQRPLTSTARNKSATACPTQANKLDSSPGHYNNVNNSQFQHKSPKINNGVNKNMGNGDTIQRKFHNEPIARSIVGYMAHAIPSRMASMRWIKDLAKATLHQGEIVEP